MSEHTEWLIAEVRSSAYKNADTPSGALMRALVDCADQRDELRAACEAVIEAAETIHADWHPVIAKVLAALEKVRETDG